MNNPSPSSTNPKKVLRLLLTGASGYVGQHLLHALLTDTCHEWTAGVRLQITATYGSLSTFADDCNKFISSSSAVEIELLNQTVFNIADSHSMETYFESRRRRNLARHPSITTNETDASSSSVLLAEPPFDIVIHLAAMSSPLECQKNQPLASLINTPTTLITCLREEQQRYYQQTHVQHTLTFIFASTDQVYDGSKSFYDSDTDTPLPIHFYGQSKLDMEHLLLQQQQQQHDSSSSSSAASFIPIILRSSLVLGPKTPLGTCRKQSFLQFVQDIVRSYKQNQDKNHTQKKYDFYTNEYRNVIHVTDVIQIMRYFIRNHIDTIFHRSGVSSTPIEIQQKHNTSIYNMGGKDRVSRWDILMAVAQYYGLQHEDIDLFATPAERINPILPSSVHGLSSENPVLTSVPSPLDISMCVDKLQQKTGLQFMGLSDMVALTFIDSEL